MEALHKVGSFDEGYGITLAHADFSLSLRATGGTIWFEPSAIIKFQLPPPLEFQDLGCFMSIWNESEINSSLQHFSTKWGVKIDHRLRKWTLRYHRRSLFFLRFAVARWFGSKAGKVAWVLCWPAESMLSWLIHAWNRVPNRRQRLEALGAWRTPGLDPALIKALADKLFSQPRPLNRDFSLNETPVAETAVLETVN